MKQEIKAVFKVNKEKQINNIINYHDGLWSVLTTKLTVAELTRTTSTNMTSADTSRLIKRTFYSALDQDTREDFISEAKTWALLKNSKKNILGYYDVPLAFYKEFYRNMEKSDES